MTGSEPDTRDPATRPISVAELLARNGAIGSPPVTGRRRRRRGNSDAVTVAELTGEIPVIKDDDPPPTAAGPVAGAVADVPAAPESTADPTPATVAEPEPTPTVGWSEPGPRWPRSSPQSARDAGGPEPSHYPRPVRRSAVAQPQRSDAPPAPASGAEQMSPDPAGGYPDIPMGALSTEPPAADEATAAPDERPARRRLFGRRRPVDATPGPDTAEAATGPDREPADLDEDRSDVEQDPTGEPAAERGVWAELWGGGLIVLQSLVAVLLGAGLFIAFDQLWRWNNIVALVLTVLVTLGMVAAVQAVRRTVDIGSTLIAVAVGLLVTLGPLALHAN